MIRYGDKDDPERVRLIIEQELERQKSRDAAEVRSRNTTSLKPREPIPLKKRIHYNILSMKSIQNTDVAVEMTRVKELLTDKKEAIQHGELIRENQVLTHDMEPSFQMHNESLVVVHSRADNGKLTENTEAHQVFDRMRRRKHRLCHKKKLSISPKSWKFKYKPKEVGIKRAHNRIFYVASLFEHRVNWLRRAKKRKSWSLAMQLPREDDQFQVKHKWRFKLSKPVSDLTLAAKNKLHQQRFFHGSSHINFGSLMITQGWLQVWIQQFTNGVLTSQEENKWSFKHVGVLSKLLGDDREMILPYESTFPQLQSEIKMDLKVMKMDRDVFMKDGGEFSRDVYLKYDVKFTGKSQIRRDDERNLTQWRRDSNTTMNRDRIKGATEFVHSGDNGYAQIRHDGDGISRSMFSQNRFMRNCESKVIEMNRWDGKIDHDDVKLFHDDSERERLIFEQDREMQKWRDAATVRRSNTISLKAREPISADESIQDDNIMLGMESIQRQLEHRQHKSIMDSELFDENLLGQRKEEIQAI
ncbi:unnamed protein product [Cochlearia groenlandica]